MCHQSEQSAVAYFQADICWLWVILGPPFYKFLLASCLEPCSSFLILCQKYVRKHGDEMQVWVLTHTRVWQYFYARGELQSAKPISLQSNYVADPHWLIHSMHQCLLCMCQTVLEQKSGDIQNTNSPTSCCYSMLIYLCFTRSWVIFCLFDRKPRTLQPPNSEGNST